MSEMHFSFYSGVNLFGHMDIHVLSEAQTLHWVQQTLLNELFEYIMGEKKVYGDIVTWSCGVNSVINTMYLL